MKGFVFVFLAALASAEPPVLHYRAAKILFQRQELSPEREATTPSISHAPYPASGWKPAKEFKLPARQSGPPATSYGVPDASYAAPFTSYSAPQNSYGPPQAFSLPKNSYGAPQAFSAHKNSHNARQTYSAPQKSYGAPQTFVAPQKIYNAPQTYSAPQTSYGVPQTLSLPQNSYGAPRTFSAPHNEYGAPTRGPVAEITTPIYEATTTTDIESLKVIGLQKTEKNAKQSVSSSSVLSNQGAYYVLLPDSRLQKVEFRTENDVRNMAYTAKLRYRDEDRAPIYVFTGAPQPAQAAPDRTAPAAYVQFV